MPRRTRLVLLAAVALAATLAPSLRLRAAGSAVTISIDAGANRRPIDPRIYGVSYGTTTQLQELRVPLVRLGGNNTSRYNWQQNADNRAGDWYFESIPAQSGSAGEVGDSFVGDGQGRRRAADADLPDAAVDREGRPEPRQARQLLDRQVRRRRPTPTGRGSPTPATASGPAVPTSPATIPTTRTCRTTWRSSSSGRSTSCSAGARPRPAACATTSSTTSTRSGTRRTATCCRREPGWTRCAT